MYRLAGWVLKRRGVVLGLFAVACLVSVFAMQKVTVNYSLVDYLPEQAPSTVALDAMEAAYANHPANLRAMVNGVTIPEALDYKERITAVNGVRDVTWLDDVCELTQPLAMLPKKTVEAWYKDGSALITAYVEPETARAALAEIREIVGADNALAGDIVQSNETQLGAKRDVAKILFLAVPIIFAILLLATNSYIEPVLFLMTIGVAILLGKGSDLIFGEISFITSTCSAILQLAISMDYAIFLLERFEEYRGEGKPVEEAMRLAMTSAFSSILSSALTTIIGFLALVLMQFRIGYDLGLVLAKGITLSLVSVLFLLPVMTSYAVKLLDKTHHRRFMPRFATFGRINARLCVPTLLIALVVIVPCYRANANNAFVYGSSEMITDPQSAVVRDQAAINAKFAKANQMVLMVPEGDLARERRMQDDLLDIGQVSSIASYVSVAGETIPVDYVGRDQLGQLLSGGLSRLLLTVDTDNESAEAFSIVERVRAVAQEYYPDAYYLTGGTVNTYDMRDTVLADNIIVNGVAILAIGVTLLFNFQSLLLPLLLLLVIESSIWINLAVPYFQSENFYYIALLIINAVQLGATVDYAILFTGRYLDARRETGRVAAAARAITATTSAIVTSAGILFTGGTALGNFSTVAIIGQLGHLVGRGALISAVMVLLVLPGLLIVFDPLIKLTTVKADFFHKPRHKKEA